MCAFFAGNECLLGTGGAQYRLAVSGSGFQSTIVDALCATEPTTSEPTTPEGPAEGTSAARSIWANAGAVLTAGSVALAVAHAL